MSVPFPNITIDIWDNLTPAPGVGPNQNGVQGAILTPFYPIDTPETPIPGVPLIHRILINHVFFRSPIFSVGGGAYNYNCFFRIVPNPFLIAQVYRIIALSPQTSLTGMRYWHAYAVYWGPQP